MTPLAALATTADRANPIPFAVTTITPAARAASDRVLASGWVTSGPEVMAFEEEFAAHVGARHAVAVSSCTAAIELSLRALGLDPGAPVLTSSFTFCGAVQAIVHAGLRPVLVDVDRDTLMPSPATTAAAIALHGRAAAMLVVHYAGQPAAVEALAAAADLPLSRVVEDAAHAIGTHTGVAWVGSTSAATCFSFYATKNLPIGEGGMVTTDDPALADRVRCSRLHGMTSDAWRRYLPGGSWRYSVDQAGLKANMTDVQAAIGRSQLVELPRWQARRAELAHRYDTALAAVPGLRLPARPSLGRHAWHLYVVRIGAEFGCHRDEVARALAEQSIFTSVHFIPVHTHPYFRDLLGLAGTARLHTAESVFEEVLSLPLHPALTDADVDRVANALGGLALARPYEGDPPCSTLCD